ncbi:aspartate kinase [bacterium]|nr:aspartate kinase [bacterium]
MVVQKFGGTSVADTDRIKKVAQTVIHEKELGNDVIVVVSAMGHTTDNLLKLAGEITSNPSPREMDALLSTGECVSIALLTMAIQSFGYKAVSLNAAQVGIYTENIHTKARIINIKTETLKKYLAEDNIIVIAGFQGMTSNGDITTLGRGGSDTSAVAIAATVQAERCDIYTDVNGVYTADPRIVPKATKLEEISYDEMLELSSVGANVMHPRAVETGKQHKLPIRVRSSFNINDIGTVIHGVRDMELQKPVTGVATDLSQVRIVACDVPDKPGTAAQLFGALAKEHISVDMIIQSYARKVENTNDIAFTIDKTDLPKAVSVLEKLRKEVNLGNVHIDNDIAKVSIIGAGMINNTGVASCMFKTLADLDINIKMISTSEIKISCLVDVNDSTKAVQALHDAFNLAGDEVAEVHGTLPD